MCVCVVVGAGEGGGRESEGGREDGMGRWLVLAAEGARHARECACVSLSDDHPVGGRILYNTQLSGTIPSTIGELSNLQKL